MIVWLASYPRSGNTLARLALFHLFGQRSASIYPSGPTGLPPEKSLAVRPLLDRRPAELLDALDGPVFVKTHELQHAADDRPAVVVVRDGRDALVSYAHFLSDERGDAAGFEHLLGELVRGPGGSMGTWSESVWTWRSRSAPTALIRYEDLQAAPAPALRRAAHEAGVELGEPRGQLPSFVRLHDEGPGVFRKGRVGSWVGEMSADLEDLFWGRHGAAMQALGYER